MCAPTTRSFVAPAQRMFERLERRFVYIDRSVTRARLGLGQPDRADRRLTEYRGGDILVVDTTPLPAEQRVGHRMALRNRYRCEIFAIGQIADSVDIRNR